MMDIFDQATIWMWLGYTGVIYGGCWGFIFIRQIGGLMSA